MQGRSQQSSGNRRRKALLGLAILSILLAPVDIGGAAEQKDPCETEAFGAYLKALKLCELAQASNPRLRCYEAARAVYRETLQHCREGSVR